MRCIEVQLYTDLREKESCSELHTDLLPSMSGFLIQRKYKLICIRTPIYQEKDPYILPIH